MRQAALIKAVDKTDFIVHYRRAMNGNGTFEVHLAQAALHREIGAGAVRLRRRKGWSQALLAKRLKVIRTAGGGSPLGRAVGTRPARTRQASAPWRRRIHQEVFMRQAATVLNPDYPPSVRQRLKAERVQEMLQALPAWRVLEGGKAIDRAFLFPSPQVAGAYAAFVLAFASAAGQPVTLDHHQSQVVVTLARPRVKGRQLDLNVDLLTFARKLG